MSRLSNLRQLEIENKIWIKEIVKEQLMQFQRINEEII